MRIGKSKRKSYLMGACARYLLTHGPSTSSHIYHNAKLRNGRLVRNKYGSTQTIANAMQKRSDFYVAGKSDRKSVNLWMVKEDSELLQ